MKKWDYAELSKVAKEFGGPEKYIEFLEEINRQKGKSEMLPWIWVSALGASLLTLSTIKIVNITRSHKQKRESEGEMAKAELIAKINEYDKTQIEEGGVSNE